MFTDFFVDMALSIIFKLLKDSIKNPASKVTWRKAMLKLRDQINFTFGDDTEFAVSAAKYKELQTKFEVK